MDKMRQEISSSMKKHYMVQAVMRVLEPMFNSNDQKM